jgi:hypothetical protein
MSCMLIIINVSDVLYIDCNRCVCCVDCDEFVPHSDRNECVYHIDV